MLIYEYKVDGTKKHYAAIDELIGVVQFTDNKCLRLWMDETDICKNNLPVYCAVLAKEYPFAARLNSQARQASAGRAWFAISRFYENGKAHKPGKKGYPAFPHENRGVEYKTTGWKLEPGGCHLPFTDGCGIGRLRLIGTRDMETLPTKQIKRVRIASEPLQIRHMVKNRHLAKSIHDAGWGHFLRWVNASGAMHDIAVIALAPQWTSQTCSQCGTLVKKSLSVRTQICHGCGIVLDRDHHAAVNMLQKAHGTLRHRGTREQAS